MHIPSSQWCLIASLLLLQACSSSFDKTDAEVHQVATQRAQQAQAVARQQTALPPLVRDEKQVRFTSRSVPLVQSAILPSHIQSVTVKFPGRHNLSTIADVLTRTLGVVVFMTPDALMDPRNFTPVKAAGSIQAAPGGSGNSPTGLPTNLDPMHLAAPAVMQAGGNRLGLTPEQAVNTFELNYSGPLAGLLDSLANQAQLRWSYEEGRIVFRRVITQFIPVRALPGGLKGSGSFTFGMSGNTANLTSELGGELWEALGRTIPMMLSASGQFQIDSKLGMVTVRDAVDNVQEVERYIKQINDLYMRQVSIQVEVVLVDLATEAQSGIDWADVSLNVQTTSNASLRSSGPAFLKGSTDPGSVGVYRGASQILFKSLERYGRVSTMYSTVVNTMHRQTVPLSVTNSKTYVRSITAGTVTNGTVTGPTLTASDLVTGFTINLMPVILDSNRVLLETAIGISSMRELVSYSLGSGFGQSSVQQPNVDSFLNVQRVGLGLGETLVLLGYEYEEARNTTTDVARDKFPGSRLSQGGKKSVVILLTPLINES
jgi:hypothetical protein